MNQRGSLILYALVALAVMGTLAAIVAGIYSKGREAGRLSVQTAWDEANRKAAAQAEKDRQFRESEANKAVAAQQSAERKARDYESKWRMARNVLRDVPLAIPSCPSTEPENAPTGPDSRPSAPLMLTWAFSLQWDAAWTGQTGEPVFPDTGDPASRPPAAGAAVSIDQALDNHAENAARCSANSRQLGNLIGLIRRLQAQ